MSVKTVVKRAFSAAGYDVRRVRGLPVLKETLPAADEATIAAVTPYTMTSRERLLAACDAVRYLEQYAIPGAIVECGVWAGGSMMAVARTLLDIGTTTRDIYLFDTFEGMSEPTAADLDLNGRAAADLLVQSERETARIWCYSSLSEVRANLVSTGYPVERVHFVEGKVEDTIPAQAPDQIALLRLDTDWYESTKHELDHLVERVAPNGVLIIDDYGHWQGARRAVDEWLAASSRPVLLNRIDYTGRIAVLTA